MSFAVAGLLCDGPLMIRNGECINISYPEFYSDLYSLAEKYMINARIILH